MPHHAKHHASSIAAIERSLVIRIRDGFEPRRGSVMIIQNGENDTTTDPLRGSYFVHIAITKLRVLAYRHLHGVSHHLASPMPVSVSVPIPMPVPAVVSVSP